MKPATIPSKFPFKIQQKVKQRSQRLLIHGANERTAVTNDIPIPNTSTSSSYQEEHPTTSNDPPVVLIDDGLDVVLVEVCEEEESFLVNDVDLGTGTPDDYETDNSQISACDFISFSIFQFQNNDKAIHYYTSFNNFSHFKMFYTILGPAVNHLKPQISCMHSMDQLFMFLIKIRQAKEDLELSILFHISETTVSKLINIWTNFLYLQLKEIPIWTSSSVSREFMPKSFAASYPKTRVVLDATEIPIAKPSIVSAQSLTFSTYKNRNTVKVMVGINPKGLVTCIRSLCWVNK